MPQAVWTVLTDPALTRSCLLGLAVDSTFDVGSPIRFHGPAGTVVGGRVLAHEPGRLLAHSIGDLSCDLVASGLDEHDPTCWVSWLVEVENHEPPRSRVTLTVDEFDEDDDAFAAWCGALRALERVLAAPPSESSE
ncbi:MAG TPA: hypothetical protein VMI11_14560 [Actinomycetes bacterium]|nr:hypothetical protein [Actinomycetes bacterium]